MKIDPELLKKITSQSLANKSQGIKGLINSIHKDTQLRNWVTIESMPLPPIPYKIDDQWHLLTLLVTTKTLETATQVFNPPWGAIKWIIPQGNVVETQDLSENTAIIQLQSNQENLIKLTPTDSTVNLDSKTRLMREEALFQLLDKLVVEDFSLSKLAPHYAGLLPREIYDYYWLLIPESKEWLNRDVKAWDLSHRETQSITIEAEKNKREIPIIGDQESTGKTVSPSESSLNQWLSELEEIATQYDLEDFSNQLHHYQYRLLQPGFRLAVVGEFSRGKSNLINCLLGDDFLPTGSLPTTSTLISIFPSQENQITIYFPDQRVENRQLSQEAWEDLLATDPTGNNQEILAKVRVKINNSWLEKLDVELIDTPGANDLGSRRSGLVFDLLNQCDAAVLVISATLPFSLTETSFLEQEIIGRHVPRILVVVSKLDMVKADEREAVFENITSRIGKISPEVTVLPLHPLDDHQSSTDTITAIKTHLEKMVDKGERRLWRSRQVTGQVLNGCQKLKNLAETAIAKAQLAESERQTEIKKIEASIQKAEIYWQELTINLDSRRLKNYQNLDRNIMEFKTTLLDVLKFQLKKASNPKLWWQEDLPFVLRKEFVNFSRNVENSLIQKIAEDNSWVEAKVKEYFGQEIATIMPVSNYNYELTSHFENLPLADLQQYRLLTRLGSSAAIIAGYILGGPIGIVCSTGIWLWGENTINQTVTEQKQTVEQELEQKVSLSLNQYSQKVAARLTEIYQQILQEINKEKQQWRQNQQILITTMKSTEELEKWHKLTEQINQIERKVNQELKKIN